MAAPRVIVEPAGRVCWDEPVRIAVRGLAPEQPVALRASLRDEKGALFRAHARYRADARGQLDLQRAPALGGSFAGLEPMGLLWAMQPDRPFWRLVKRDVQTPLQVELEVLDDREPHEPAGPEGGRVLARAVHERHFMAAGVRRVPVREGRVRATLFLPPGPGPFPGIIDLFGVGGGLLEYRASLLAGKGFAVMALAYYNYDDLPKDMQILHLEYFEEAMNYLLRHPQVKGSGVGVLGISKGGELGIAMASFLKGITAAVIINGSVSNVGGTIYYKDETVLPVGMDPSRVTMTKDGIMDVVDALNNPLEGPDQKSIFPVERSDTAFLFLVGQDDHNWKSEFYANVTSERLEAHGKEKPQIILYPEAGHYIEPPYFPLYRAGMHLMVGATILLGGEPRAHAMAQLDAWEQLQIFFHRHLGGTEGTIPAKL
ncbi:acyl-coenzyme A thioesterase 3-like isoform X3 [Perognathus longimembris pacificus]|uniref:acyl-coenzyme A thioesterase 3-like isoform X3 n=1 Tax=Perognathus longimembris pacificus TaxID=214514 RepID=UPI002019D68A|nr:acyl-coenzyme A thioesterase 3-like isoform X3 [Perognathus longimembris pacificus]